MQRMSGFPKVSSRTLLPMFVLAVFLQGCTIDVKVQGMECAKRGGPFEGCNVLDAPGVSAEGFKGIGGPNPVGSGITCGSGAYATNPGTSCSFGKKCRNNYTYPAGGGSGGACSWACNP